MNQLIVKEKKMPSHDLLKNTFDLKYSKKDFILKDKPHIFKKALILL